MDFRVSLTRANKQLCDSTLDLSRLVLVGKRLSQSEIILISCVLVLVVRTDVFGLPVGAIQAPRPTHLCSSAYTAK